MWKMTVCIFFGQHQGSQSKKGKTELNLTMTPSSVTLFKDVCQYSLYLKTQADKTEGMCPSAGWLKGQF